jgi:hypothetical protein
LSESDAKTVAKRVLAQAQTLGWNVKVRVTDEGGKKNPLTRRETAQVLRGARQDMRRAKRAPTGTPARAYRLGRVDVGQALAYQHGEAKLRRMRGREFMMNYPKGSPLAKLITQVRHALLFHGQQASSKQIEDAALEIMLVEDDFKWSGALFSGTKHADLRLAAVRRRREKIDEAMKKLFSQAKDISRSPTNGNPPPRVVGTIPGRMTRIEYQRTGEHPGRYYHNFKPGVSARVLSDGSVLLQGPRRLHIKE